MQAASLKTRDNHDETVTWLVLQGAANDEISGHVDAAILKRDIPANNDSPTALQRQLAALLDQHAAFTRLVLPATRTAEAASAVAPTVAPCFTQAPLPLALLCGHEETLLAHITDFAGVVRGRQLRNAREVFGLLAREYAEAAEVNLENVRIAHAEAQASWAAMQAALANAEADAAQAQRYLALLPQNLPKNDAIGARAEAVECSGGRYDFGARKGYPRNDVGGIEA